MCTELTSALKNAKRKEILLVRNFVKVKLKLKRCSQSTSGRCEVIVVEEVRQRRAHFRGAAVHHALLAIAESRENNLRSAHVKTLSDVPEHATVTDHLLL